MHELREVFIKNRNFLVYKLGSSSPDVLWNFFTVFHQVRGPPHANFLHFTWFTHFLIVLQQSRPSLRNRMLKLYSYTAVARRPSTQATCSYDNLLSLSVCVENFVKESVSQSPFTLLVARSTWLNDVTSLEGQSVTLTLQ